MRMHLTCDSLLTMLLKKSVFLALIYLFMGVGNANELGKQIGVTTVTYVQSCISLQILKKYYCGWIDAPKTEVCVNQVYEVLPKGLKQEFLEVANKELIQNLDGQIARIKPSIELGFNKTLARLNGDKNATCIHINASTQTYKLQKLDELKTFVNLIKNN